MSWMQTIPYIVGVAVFLLMPGLIILRAAGIRGLGTFAFAIPTSATVMGISAIIGGLLSIPWGAPLFLTGFAVIAVLALLGRFALAIWKTDISTAHSSDRFDTPVVDRLQHIRWGVDVPVALIYAAAVGLPAFAIFYRYAHGFGNVENVSQTFDNIYHLNAVRTIIDTRDGSSLTLGNLTPESQTFYPAAWHDMVSLISMVFHLSIPASINVTNIVIGSLVWPLSLLFLITRITGPRLLPIVLTAALAPAFPAFPYLMVDFGVLYPNHLAIAVLPAVIGAFIQLMNMTQASEPTFWTGFVSLALGLPGMLLAHPSTLLAFIAFILPIFLTRVWWAFVTRRVSEGHRRAFILYGVSFALFCGAGLLCWIKIRPSAASSTWPSFQTQAQATGEVLAGTPMGLPHGGLMFILTVTGLVFLLVTKRQRWVVGMFAMGAWLYVVCTSYPVGDFRTFVSGIWYNDSNRLAALLPVTSAPVVILGAEFVIRWVTKKVMQSAPYTRLAESKIPALNHRLIVSALLAIVLTGAIGFHLQSGAMTAEQIKFNGRYYKGPDSLLLSDDERTLLDRLPSVVPEDNVVLGNPWTGASLVYAISDRQTLRPHIYGAISKDAQYLLDRWEEASFNPAVCETIRETKTYYALDFGRLEVHRASHPLAGTEKLDGRLGIELVDREGDARLYRVTACD